MTYIRVSGGINVADTTAVAADVLNTKKIVLADGTPVDGTAVPISETTYTPTTTNQVIPVGSYLSGNQIIQPDANFVASNIRSSKTIFGINGSLVDMTDNAYWWNNGSVTGKPFEGGFLEYSIRYGWSKKTNNTDINPEYAYNPNSGSINITYAWSRYTFYTGPYKGFEVTASNMWQTTGNITTYIQLYATDRSTMIKNWSFSTAIGTTNTVQLTDDSLSSQWCYMRIHGVPASAKTCWTSVTKIRPILR